jgi:hypothetical protein
MKKREAEACPEGTAGLSPGFQPFAQLAQMIRPYV